MPAVTPVTIPAVPSTVAIAVRLLDHVPPDGLPARVVVDPAHIACVPVTVAVIGTSTSTVVVAIALTPGHSVGAEYEIIAVPAPSPVTTPDDEFTEATAVLPLNQPPPLCPVGSLRVIVDPAHTAAGPVIAPGSGSTVIAYGAAGKEPQLLV